MTDRDDIDALLETAGGLPYGPARVELCELAADIADSRNDLDAGFVARLAVTEAATFGDHPPVVLVAFARLLADFDADPRRFAAHELSLLWRYKWAVAAAIKIPDIKALLHGALLYDMARRYTAYGASLQPVHMAERVAAVAVHDWPRARAAHAKLTRNYARDALSDSPASVLDADVCYWINVGDADAAVAAAGPALSGELAGDVVVRNVYANLLGPLLDVDRPADAARCHRAGYPLVADGPYDAHRADHVEYLVRVGELARAADLAARHLAAADALQSPAGRLYCLSAYRLLFCELTLRRVTPVRLSLPPGHPLQVCGRSGRFPVRPVFDWLDAETRVLAIQFDARNGDTHRVDCLGYQSRALTGCLLTRFVAWYFRVPPWFETPVNLR